MRINVSPRFKRSYKKLPTKIQQDFDKKVVLFIENPKDPILKSHKLKGKLRSCLAFDLKEGYRVLFKYAENQSVNLLDIGNHDKYAHWGK